MRPITVVLQNMKDFVGSCAMAIPLMIWICLFRDRRSDYLCFQFRFRNTNGYHGSWYGEEREHKIQVGVKVGNLSVSCNRGIREPRLGWALTGLCRVEWEPGWTPGNASKGVKEVRLDQSPSGGLVVFRSSSPEHRKITSHLCDGLADGDEKDKLKLASTRVGGKNRNMTSERPKEKLVQSHLF